MNLNVEMVDKILKSTRGRSCSCPIHKTCSGCYSMKVIPSNHNAKYFEKPNRWKLPKRQKYEADPKTSPLCKWYRRRNALKELIAVHKKEELLNKEGREEYERDRMKELMELKRNHEEARYLSTNNGDFKWRRDQRSSSLPPRKKEKLYIKERSASVKPHTRSRKVSAKRYNTRDTITRRFVNYCYRLCCQFYCYLTCIILIIFTVICII